MEKSAEYPLSTVYSTESEQQAIFLPPSFPPSLLPSLSLSPPHHTHTLCLSLPIPSSLCLSHTTNKHTHTHILSPPLPQKKTFSPPHTLFLSPHTLFLSPHTLFLSPHTPAGMSLSMQSRKSPEVTIPGFRSSAIPEENG